jgi:DNA-binding NtrC family response regulator
MEGDRDHMRKIVLAVLLIAGVFLLGIAVVEACGDKALRIGRGIRFQRTTHPAAVLIYIPSNATRAAQVQSLLKKVGHKSYAAQGEDSFSDALRSGKYDLVFSDLGVASSLGKQIENSPSRPVLVAVVSEGTKAEVAAAQKHYSHLVKNPHSAERYLDALEGAMRSRVRLIAKKV